MIFRLGIGAALILAVVLGILGYGKHRFDEGRMSYKAEVEAEIAKTNHEIAKGKAEDAQISAREFASDAGAAKTFEAALPSLGKCLLSAEAVAALNPLGKE